MIKKSAEKISSEDQVFRNSGQKFINKSLGNKFISLPNSYLCEESGVDTMIKNSLFMIDMVICFYMFLARSLTKLFIP